jgi:hypothetical protein
MIEMMCLCKGLTKDVDLTITNILEGRVPYKAEEPAVEADRTTTSSHSTIKVLPVRIPLKDDFLGFY